MTREEFNRLLNGNQPVLVDIGAVWCPPCKKMEPIINELVESNGTKFRLVQVDGGVQELLVKELNANSFPTFIIYKNGKEVWRKEGLVSKKYYFIPSTIISDFRIHRLYYTLDCLILTW